MSKETSLHDAILRDVSASLREQGIPGVVTITWSDPFRVIVYVDRVYYGLWDCVENAFIGGE